MKIHRFIDSAFNLDTATIIVTKPETINQWVNVLRIKIGEIIVVCDGSGFESEATIKNISKGSIEITLKGKILNMTEPRRKVTLYAAVLKKENFELVVQKSAEVGVAKIIPVLTERTIKQNVRLDRLTKIAEEAAEQSGRAVVPQVSEPTSFISAITEAIQNGAVYFLDLTATEPFSKLVSGNSPVSIFIGPEGGFTDVEISEARNLGAKPASLGSSILRGETAAIVATWCATQ